jgi:ubiquinone/menaquinone biosynthesis C-methylase UbiE
VSFREWFLGKSFGYETFKRAIGADRAMSVFASEYIVPRPGDRLLDVGCGIGDMVQYLPGVSYVGVDYNEQYIRTATRRHDDVGARFLHASVDDLPRLGLDGFDCAIVVSALHHLTDDQVAGLVVSLQKVVRPEGRLVTVDPVWKPDQATTARVLIALDRGRHVRDVDGYARLLGKGFDDLEFTVRQDLLRLPYSYCVSRSRRADS